MCSHDNIEKSKKPKKLSQVQKDLPRFKVIMEYEREFKNNYASTIASGFKMMMKVAKKHSK